MSEQAKAAVESLLALGTMSEQLRTAKADVEKLMAMRAQLQDDLYVAEEQLRWHRDERKRVMERLRRWDNPQNEDLEMIVDAALRFRAQLLDEAQRYIDELEDKWQPVEAAINAVRGGKSFSGDSLSSGCCLAWKDSDMAICSLSRMTELIETEKKYRQLIGEVRE